MFVLPSFSRIRSSRRPWISYIVAVLALSLPLGLAAAATGAPQTKQSPSAQIATPALPAFAVSVPADNTFNSATAAATNNDDQASLWLHYTSPSTPTISPDSEHNARRVIDTWNQPDTWMVIRFEIPTAADWPTIVSGMGSIVDVHNVAGDQVTPDGRGIGWGYGSGVSPFHFAVGGRDEVAYGLHGVNQTLPALQPFVQLEQTWDPSVNGPLRPYLPMVQPGKAYTAIVRIQWGRNDFIADDSMPPQDRRPGELDVWASPDPSQPLQRVVQARNVNTLIRATRPTDGASIIQRYLDGWDGGPYILRSTRENGGNKVWKHIQWATQYGATLGQALADDPAVVGDPNGQHSVHAAGTPDLGDAHADAVTMTPSAPILPADLQADLQAQLPATTPAVVAASPSGPGTGGDHPVLSSLTPVTDAGCASCRATVGNGTVSASIVGGLDSLDTAYGQADFGGVGGWSKRLFVHDALAIGSAQRVGGNLSVLQVLDVHGSLIYELYVAGADRTLRLFSPAGGLQASPISVSTNVTVPSDGTPLAVDVASLPNDSITVKVDGTTRIVMTGLTGAVTGNQRYLRAGVDHYDTGGTTDGISVSHSGLGASTNGWLQSAGSASSPPTGQPQQPTATTTTTTASTSSSSDPQPLLDGLDVVTDPGCGACRATVGTGTVSATISGGRDNLDTAYGEADIGGPSGLAGRVFTRDTIALGGRPGGNLSVTQVRDTNGALVYELYIAGADSTLRLWSPDGGLRASSLNLSTGVVVPADGTPVTAEVSALANDSVIVRVNGIDRITVTGLSGAKTGRQDYLRAGIDHYDTAGASDGISVQHSRLGATTQGWLGNSVGDASTPQRTGTGGTASQPTRTTSTATPSAPPTQTTTSQPTGSDPSTPSGSLSSTSSGPGSSTTGIVDGASVSITGPTRMLADGGIIVSDQDGTGHRLYATATVPQSALTAIIGQTVTVQGTADVTNEAAVIHWPINVRSIVAAS